MAVQDAPAWRALVTAAVRLASAAAACWWAVATQPRTSTSCPVGSGTGRWPLPRLERAALQDGHNATAPTWMVAVSVVACVVAQRRAVNGSLTLRGGHDAASWAGRRRVLRVRVGLVRPVVNC